VNFPSTEYGEEGPLNFPSIEHGERGALNLPSIEYGEEGTMGSRVLGTSVLRIASSWLPVVTVIPVLTTILSSGTEAGLSSMVEVVVVKPVDHRLESCPSPFRRGLS
jgi:hypothetical protein